MVTVRRVTVSVPRVLVQEITDWQHAKKVSSFSEAFSIIARAGLNQLQKAEREGQLSLSFDQDLGNGLSDLRARVSYLETVKKQCGSC